MSKVVAQLKERVLVAEERVRLLQSMLDSFWTGDVPANASLDHLMLAKWGRKRLEDKAKTPALFAPKQ